MSRGFRAPDDSDLKPFETENVNSVASAAEEASASTTIDCALFKARSRHKNITRLPVYNYNNDILYLLEQKPTLILSGETGSGKSTLVPPILLKSYNRILVIEPRRLAAITLAKRVENILSEPNEFEKSSKKLVGHGVRFEHNFDEASRIVFVTDGVFLNMLMTDPLLNAWDVIIVDECHERTISLDICLGLLKKIITKRYENLKLIVMSATFDMKNFVDFFGFDKCKCLSVQGRENAVSIFYLSAAVPNYIKAVEQTIVDICSQKPSIPGDILVFLTSSIEIEECVKSLKSNEFDKKFDLFITQLYSTMPSNQQLKSIEPMMSRKLRRVVVSTNIAETSLSISCL